MPTEARSLRRYAYLDSIRAIAALWVVLHHAWFQVQARLTGTPQRFLSFFSGGEWAVELFIALSGFCLMLPVVRNGGLKGGALAFLKRRAWRILPPYYFAILLSLALIALLIGRPTGTHWDDALPVTIHSVVTHFLLVEDCFASDYGTINHVFWSIAVEARIYLFFPPLVWVWLRFGPVAAVISGLAVSFLLARLFLRLGQNSLHFEYLGIFTEGMLGAAIAFSSEASFVRARAWPWGWIVLALTVVNCLPVAENRLHYFITGLWFASILVLVSDPAGLLYRLLNFRPLALLGTFAYSLYLVHAPLLQVLWQYPFAPLQGRPVLMFTALIFPGVPLIMAAAYLFFIVCERPFLLGRRRAIVEVSAPARTRPATEPPRA
jgi:peptidoglycan/LPS O-acetylase OafA/YrhL